MKRLILFLFLFSLAIEARASDYYIDFVGGSDSNDGLTKTTAWKHSPGMTGVSGVPAAIDTYTGLDENSAQTPCYNGCNYSDYNFIFKGGVTWDNTSFPWTIRQYGTSGHTVKWTVDNTWFTGGSWARPIFNWGGISSGDFCNHMLIFAPVAYWVFDNFEWTGLYWSTCQTSTGYIALGIGGNGELKNNYFHGWTHSTATGTYDPCTLTAGNSEGVDVTTTAHDNVFDGTDSTDYSTGYTTCYAFNGHPAIVYNNWMSYVVNGWLGAYPVSFYQNTCDHVGNSWSFAHGGNEVHDQCFESNVDRDNFVFHDNLIQHTNAGIMVNTTPPLNYNTYIFNNVSWDRLGNGNGYVCYYPIAGGQGGTCNYYNNTNHDDISGVQNFVGCFDTSPNFITACNYKNNHFIGPKATSISTDCAASTTCHQDHNLGQTVATANSNGYYDSTMYPYSPTIISGGTIGTGVNLSSNCGLLPSLCITSTVGVGYNQTSHTVIVPNFTNPLNRSPSGDWDIGAYQFTNSILAPSLFGFTYHTVVTQNITKTKMTLMLLFYPVFTTSLLIALQQLLAKRSTKVNVSVKEKVGVRVR